MKSHENSKTMRVLLLCVPLFFHFHKSSSQIAQVSSKLVYDTTKIAIVLFDVKNFYGTLDTTNTASTLTQDDILEIEKIFLQSVAEHDSALTGYDKISFYVDLKQWYYRRQYICYVNKAGERIVYVNCFCAAFSDWRSHMVIVDDGGRCFFSVSINLTTRKYFDFIVNGSA